MFSFLVEVKKCIIKSTPNGMLFSISVYCSISAINALNGNSFRFSNLSSTPHTITVRRTSKNKQILHCALLYITNDCAAMINMDMVSGNVSGTKVYPICGTNTPTASVSNDELKISINAWRNVLLLMPENEFSATLSE